MLQAQIFCCKFYEILRTTFSAEHLWLTASKRCSLRKIMNNCVSFVIFKKYFCKSQPCLNLVSLKQNFTVIATFSDRLWCHKHLSAIDLLLFYRENFYGFSVSDLYMKTLRKIKSFHYIYIYIYIYIYTYNIKYNIGAIHII